MSGRTEEWMLNPDSRLYSHRPDLYLPCNYKDISLLEEKLDAKGIVKPIKTAVDRLFKANSGFISDLIPEDELRQYLPFHVLELIMEYELQVAVCSGIPVDGGSINQGHRFRLSKEGEWHDSGVYADLLRVSIDGRPNNLVYYNITHGYCPECVRHYINTLN